MMVGGSRFALRLLAENRSGAALPTGHAGGTVKHVLIVGAGDAGVMVLRELQKNPQLNRLPVWFPWTTIKTN